LSFVGVLSYEATELLRSSEAKGESTLAKETQFHHSGPNIFKSISAKTLAVNYLLLSAFPKGHGF